MQYDEEDSEKYKKENLDQDKIYDWKSIKSEKELIYLWINLNSNGGK